MNIKDLYKNFSFLVLGDIKKKLVFFLGISFLFLFFNLFSFSLLIPFFSSLIEPSLINELNFFKKLKQFNFLKANTNEEILRFVGLFSLIMIIFSNYLLYLNEKFKFQLITSIAKSITSKFITSFLKIRFSDFLKYKKNLVISKLLIELESVVIQIFYNFLELVSRIFIVLVIFTALLFFEPLITIISFFSIILIFIIVYSFFKIKFRKLGIKMVEGNSERSLYLNEIISNFLNIKINNLEDYFKNLFLKATNKYYDNLASSEVTKKIPKSMIEATFFSVIILISIMLLRNDFSNMKNLILSFSAFALASYKIMPSIQQIFFSISTIKNTIPKLYSLSNELKKINKAKKITFSEQKVNFQQNPIIIAKNLYFSFNNKIIISKLNFIIKKNSIVCISGKSGSGKTTLLNCILGLIKSNKGNISVYGKNPFNLSDKLISQIFSYAPQLTSLFHFSLKKNIHLNNPYLDFKLKECLKFSNFSKLNLLKFKDLKRNLSGGEIKRILISRAIYNDSNIIIMDEPTAYLDEKNAKIVIKNIKLLKNKTIIFTTHNEKLKKIADQIIKL